MKIWQLGLLVGLLAVATLGSAGVIVVQTGKSAPPDMGYPVEPPPPLPPDNYVLANPDRPPVSANRVVTPQIEIERSSGNTVMYSVTSFMAALTGLVLALAKLVTALRQRTAPAVVKKRKSKR